MKAVRLGRIQATRSVPTRLACRSRNLWCPRSFQCFGEHASVTRSQGDSTERGERRRNICRCRSFKIFACLNPKPHQQDRHALIVIIRSAVPRACIPLGSLCRTIRQPIRLLQHKQIPAAPREIAEGKGPSKFRQCCFATAEFRTINGRHLGIIFAASSAACIAPILSQLL